MTWSEMPDLLKVKEVAGYLRLTTIRVYELIYEKQIKAVKICGSWRIRKETLQKLIEGVK